MPATSKAQQKSAAQALAAKRGEINPDHLTGSAKNMFKSMSAGKLAEFASTATQQLPEKIRKEKQTGQKNRPKRKRRMR